MAYDIQETTGRGLLEPDVVMGADTSSDLVA